MTTILTIIFLSFILIKFSKYQSYIPILMYHRIATVQNDRNALPLEKFIEQLEYLNDNNFSTITTKQLYDYYINKIFALLNLLFIFSYMFILLFTSFIITIFLKNKRIRRTCSIWTWFSSTT